MKANPIPITKSLACRRKDYKRQKEETNKKKVEKKEKRKKKQSLPDSLHLDSKKKNTLFSWLTHQLVLAIDLVCSQIFISSSFFIFSSFASFVFFMFAAGCLGFFFFFLLLKRSLLIVARFLFFFLVEL